MSLTSVAIPFILGVLAALWIIDALPNAMGVKADNITFMLAVILRDLGMIGTAMEPWSCGN